MINIDFCKTTGSIKSLKIADDPFSMNWLREDCTWGTPTEAELVSSDISANTMTSVYKLSKAELTVRRIPEKDRYREIYTYKKRFGLRRIFQARRAWYLHSFLRHI